MLLTMLRHYHHGESCAIGLPWFLICLSHFHFSDSPQISSFKFMKTKEQSKAWESTREDTHVSEFQLNSRLSDQIPMTSYGQIIWDRFWVTAFSYGVYHLFSQKWKEKGCIIHAFLNVKHLILGFCREMVNRSKKKDFMITKTSFHQAPKLICRNARKSTWGVLSCFLQ